MVVLLTGFLTLAGIGPFEPEAANASTASFTRSFTQGVATNASDLAAWRTYRESLTGSYQKLTLSTTAGRTVSVQSDTAVQELANTLRNWDTNATMIVRTIGSTVVTISGCGNGPEISIGNGQTGCSCSFDGVTFRPAIGNDNWGGTGGTCGQAAQTFTLTFEALAPSVTSFSTSTVSPTSTASAIVYSLNFASSISGLSNSDSVSYTHLTLPTNTEV